MKRFRVVCQVEDLFGEYGKKKTVRGSKEYVVEFTEGKDPSSELEDFIDDNRTPYGVGSMGWDRRITVGEYEAIPYCRGAKTKITVACPSFLR